MLPSLSGATAWINSRPLGDQDFRGKVVLIDFWTYTCINWRRTVPYLRAWVDRYGPSGLLLVGVHSPEFVFERDLENVRQQVKEIGVGYPVAVDSNLAIWEAFDNHYWPALYVFDAHGHLRHHLFGEGGYEEAEQIIRGLLEEARGHPLEASLARVDARGPEKPADWEHLRSPENYLGGARTENFESPGGIAPGAAGSYSIPPRLGLNSWALSGPWTIEADRSVSARAGARIAYRFHARDVNLVMGPVTPGREIPFRVLIDGKPPGASHGVDVDPDGRGTLREQRMYQLIRQPGAIGDRVVEVEFSGPGAGAFSFTFG
jgi:thiol-disulfide isomerase/thioredoxin